MTIKSAVNYPNTLHIATLLAWNCRPLPALVTRHTSRGVDNYAVPFNPRGMQLPIGG